MCRREEIGNKPVLYINLFINNTETLRRKMPTWLENLLSVKVVRPFSKFVLVSNKNGYPNTQGLSINECMYVFVKKIYKYKKSDIPIHTKKQCLPFVLFCFH
jgi:hypothetical protein